MYNTRSQMSNKSLTHFFVEPAFRHLTPADLMRVAPDYLIAVLQGFSQFTGMVQTYAVDKQRNERRSPSGKR